MQGNTHKIRFLVLLASVLIAIGLLSFLGCSREMGSSTALQNTVGPEGVAAQYSLQKPSDVAMLARIQETHTDRLMQDPDVVGTGLGNNAAGQAAILVLTRRPVTGLPDQLEGVAVEQRVVGTVVAYVKPGGGTVECGTSTGNDRECAAGTIGCVVLKGGNSYFLSNNHVFARENAASIGERIDAPGRYDAHPKCAQTPICGTLADFQAINFGGGNNTIDCAIALVDANRAFTCAEDAGYTPSSTVVSPSVGLAVKKDGRTSRLTHATIQAINVTVNVSYSSGVAHFVGQIMTPGSFLRPGDSGSLMVTETGNNPVGLCFAGGSSATFANPIGPVLQRFSATVCSQ